ncbi:GTP-binding protein [Planctomycetota bacterium]|nr:GTP-binding protein [Planctomycetota bacterium]
MTTPVTLISGFLGSGKTTLVQRILEESHGVRCAVIVNEFGALGVDGDLVVRREAEGSAVVELANGCICCEIQEDLRETLAQLTDPGGGRGRVGRWLRRSEGGPERILVEASGAASPGPAVQTFLLDAGLAERVHLDGVVTLLHAAKIEAQLEETEEAGTQVAYADRLVLNHSDRVEAERLPALMDMMRSLNPLAAIRHSERAVVPLDWLLGKGPTEGAGERWQQLGEEAVGPPAHTSGLRSVSLSSEEEIDRDATLMWLEFLSRRRGQELMRAKGVLRVRGGALLIQGVYQWLEATDEPGDGPRVSQLVLIGRGLDPEELLRGWRAIGGASASLS